MVLLFAVFNFNVIYNHYVRIRSLPRPPRSRPRPPPRPPAPVIPTLSLSCGGTGDLEAFVDLLLT